VEKIGAVDVERRGYRGRGKRGEGGAGGVEGSGEIQKEGDGLELDVGMRSE